MVNMFIKDPIFGNINLTETEEKIIEDKHMQRLRYIRQTGFVYLIYPGATHSRFEHSLGTLYITKELTKSIGVEEDAAEDLCVAGLVHDIGHASFSHSLDRLLKRYLHTSHEELGKGIIKESDIKNVISDSGLSLNRILKMLEGKERGEVITASLGSDRLDYLLRDAYYTGATYGVIDYQQLKSKIALYNGKLSIYAQGIPSAESILLARYFMFTSVYLHHTTLIAEGMFERAVEAAIDNGYLDKTLLKTLNDFEMMNTLLSDKPSAPLLNRIIERKLFKRVFYDRVPEDFSLSEKEIEEEILKYVDLDKTELIVTKIFPKDTVENTPILSRFGKKIGTLENTSLIIKGLEEANSQNKKLLIACEKRNIFILKPTYNIVLL